MVKNIWENISESSDFVENINFIRKVTEVAVRGFSDINSKENTCGGVL